MKTHVQYFFCKNLILYEKLRETLISNQVTDCVSTIRIDIYVSVFSLETEKHRLN